MEKKLEQKEVIVKGDFSETHHAWMLWDWDNNCPLERDDGEYTVFLDAEKAQEYRARTITICVQNEDGSEDDEDVYGEQP